MMRFRSFILILITLLPLSLLAQKASNVEVQQAGDKIEVSYTLDKEADIYLTAMVEGKYVLCKSVSGDVGQNVPAGRHTIVWDVLSDVDMFVGEAYFEVHATTSTRAQEASAAAQARKSKREKKMEDIYPLAGFDVNGGGIGIGISVFWPWVTYRSSRVGSYLSYVYGMKDWQKADVTNFHNICLGATITVSKHVALFAAPGLSIVRYKYDTEKQSSYGSYTYTTTNYGTRYQVAAEVGVGYKMSLFLFTLKCAYPYYIGVGLGIDFGLLY